MGKVFLIIVIVFIFSKALTVNLFISLIFALIVFNILKSVGKSNKKPDQKDNEKTNEEKFIKEYPFPEGLDKKILLVYPHLSKEDLMSVKQELKNFFEIKNSCQSEFIAMPSRVVDIAWHEFILYTKDYHEFCHRAFGHYLHHNPFSKDMDPEKIKRSLQRTWVYSCKAENICPESPFCLPVLFSIDSTLNIPDGNEFSIENLDESKSNNSSKSNVSLKCMNGAFVGLGAVALVVGAGNGGYEVIANEYSIIVSSESGSAGSNSGDGDGDGGGGGCGAGCGGCG